MEVMHAVSPKYFFYQIHIFFMHKASQLNRLANTVNSVLIFQKCAIFARAPTEGYFYSWGGGGGGYYTNETKKTTRIL